jgi:quercetin dioxygenase-like cupin family protein
MVRELPDLAGKEALVRANVYPPGTSNPPHRHDAHVFLHILEGQLIVQLKGAQPVTLNPGDTYYESPSDIHVMSRNPSDTVPVKALIFMVKRIGAPATTLVKD